MEEISYSKHIEAKESEEDSKSINSASLSSNSIYDEEDDNADDETSTASPDIMKQIQ